MSVFTKLFSSKAFKAWTAAIVAAVGALASASTDQVISPEEIGVAVGFFLGALGFTYKVPNAKDDE